MKTPQRTGKHSAGFVRLRVFGNETLRKDNENNFSRVSKMNTLQRTEKYKIEKKRNEI
jgi:hypothetical protein